MSISKRNANGEEESPVSAELGRNFERNNRHDGDDTETKQQLTNVTGSPVKWISLRKWLRPKSSSTSYKMIGNAFLYFDPLLIALLKEDQKIPGS